MSGLGDGPAVPAVPAVPTVPTVWREDEEELRTGGVKGGPKGKPRFTYTEVRQLLEAVKRNRYVLLKKFNQGVSAEAKKQTWTEITHQINSLGVNHREVRQIMKKWADLKCDGRRRFAALRGPNGSNLRKKNLGPVERMVHKLLMMSPRGGGESDLDLDEDEDISKLYSKGPPPNAPPFSYLSLTDSSIGGASYDFSPLSSPEKDLSGDPFYSSPDFDLADDGDRTMDFDENDDSLFSSYPSSFPPASSPSLDPLPDNALLRMKPVHTYSRNTQNQNHSSPRPPPGPSSSSAFPSVSDSDTASSSAVPPPPQSPTRCLPAPSSSMAPSSSSTSAPSSSILPPARPCSLSEPLPGASSRRVQDQVSQMSGQSRAQDQVSQMSSQSLQQQRASRMLLTSVSQSLETLAQSVQLLVESQQEFVQESLLLQRETVDILRDFSNTALTMLRDKATAHHPAAHF